MKHEYILKNLGCANCSASIEQQVKNIQGIESATLNFATSTLSLVKSDAYNGNIDKDIEKIVKSVEPSVKVFSKNDKHEHGHSHDHSHDHSHGDESSKQILVRLIISGISFVAALLLMNYGKWSILLFVISYIIASYDVIINAVRNLFKGRMLDENFLMAIASLGAIAIQEYPEGVAVMLFYQVGEYFQSRAVNRSRKSIASLMDIRPDYANVVTNDEIKKLSPEQVKIGDIIIVKPGEKVPLDGVVTDGTSMVDTSALTGESVPRKSKSVTMYCPDALTKAVL